MFREGHRILVPLSMWAGRISADGVHRKKEGWHLLSFKPVVFFRTKLRKACSRFDAESINALVPMCDTSNENKTAGTEKSDSTEIVSK